MKALLVITFLSCIFISAFAWTKEDYEIFDLVSAIEASEGKGTTFYSWLDVSPKASAAEIGKAYRKKSVTIHPDKNPRVKGIHERFARLGIVAQILRNPEQRERYDFFYKNGVPKWKGTGYLYSRFRPGLVTVCIFLTILSSMLQYLVQRLNHKRDMERIERFVTAARRVAWGPKGVPVEGKRKVKIPMNPNAVYAEDDGKGKTVDMIVEGDKVFLIADEELVPLDSSMSPKPSFQNTWALSLLRTAFDGIRNSATKSSSAKPDSSSSSEVDQTETDADLIDTDEASDTVENVKTGKVAKPVPVSLKAGGRRKNVPARKR